MARLPIPGGDAGGWGQILNDYLAQIHKADGTLKDDIVTSSAIAPNAITATAIQDGSISESKLDPGSQAKLNSGGTAGVVSVNTRSGAVTLTSADVGLANVNNTSDANKPVSIATQSALDAKAALSHTHTATQISDSTGTGRAVLLAADAAAARTAIGAGTSSLALGTTNTTAKAGDYTPTKADVGLGNVDNTSDANKPVSTVMQAALDTKQAAGSYASATHSHTASQISDSTATGRAVLQAADAAAARAAIGAGTSNLTLGTTNTTAKAGDYAPTKSDLGLGNVDNTSDANKPVSTAVSTALSGKADTAHSHVAANVSDFSTVTDARIAAASINALVDVTVNSPSNGQVLKYNGTAWINDTDNTGGAGSTDLTYSRNATTVTVESSSGLDAIIPTADATNAGILTSADKVKLDGIATSATANSSDATLLNRANHTGSQAQSTVTNLVSDLAGKAASSHTHAAADVTSGTFAIGQIPTGTTGTTVALGNHVHSGYETTLTAGTTAQYYRGDKSWQTLDKTAVGLANVNNTSDANKPISTATQSALDLKANAVAGSSNIMVYNAYSDAPALPVNTVVVSITGT